MSRIKEQALQSIIDYVQPHNETESSKFLTVGPFPKETTRAGRSVRYDRRLRKAEAAGSNPARSTPIRVQVSQAFYGQTALQESQESLQKRSARDEEIDVGMIISGNEDSLVLLWTSGDREVALNMVFTYTLNSKLKNWWSEVRLIVWGPSSRLLSEDKDLQDEIRKMKNAGGSWKLAKPVRTSMEFRSVLSN
jgi:hypothetical protein